MTTINFKSGPNVGITVNKGPLNGGTPSGSNLTIQYKNGQKFSGVEGVTTDGNALIIADIANLQVQGGTNGQLITTDGAGTLSWVAVDQLATSPSGSDFAIQFANAGSFESDSDFKFIPATNTLQVPTQTSNLITANNATVGNLQTVTANLGAVGNVTITGGTTGQVLTTNGSGTLSWSTVTTGSSTVAVAGNTTEVQFNNGGVLSASSKLRFAADTLYVDTVQANYVAGDGSRLTDITGANVVGIVPQAEDAINSTFANSANFAGQANTANFATTVTGHIQSNITMLGTLTQLSVQGITNLSDLSNVKILGGVANSVPMTDGTGNLRWFSNPGLGTVKRIGGDGNVFGVTLTGEVTEDGNLSLRGPTAPQFRENIGLGTVATIDLNGNAATFLNGEGDFTPPPDTSPKGNTYTYQYNAGGTFNGVDQLVYDQANSRISVGNLAVSGNIIVSGTNTQLGDIGTVHITGGSNAQYLSTNGSGNLSWKTLPALDYYTRNRMYSLTHSSPNETILVTLPANAVVDNVSVFVDTAYNGNPTISVGIDGAQNKYTNVNAVDLKVAGRYDNLSDDFPLTSEQFVKIYYNNGGQATVGACRVLIRYSIPE